MPLRIRSQSTERWFRQRGLVTLLDGTGVESTAAVRAAPALVALFLAVMLWGVPDLLGVALVPGVLIAVATVVATWVLANLIRRRPLFAMVARIGWIESLAFVGVPAVVALFSPRARDIAGDVPVPDALWGPVLATTMALLQLFVLVVVYLVVVSGVGALVSLLVRELLGAMSRTGSTLATVIPVLLGFVFFFFLNPGVWSAIANLDGLSYAALLGFLVVCGGLFASGQRHFSLRELAHFENRESLEEAVRETPLEGDRVAFVSTPASCPLGPRQVLNLRLVAVLSRLATATVLAAAVFLVFVILGFIVVGPETVSAWTRADPSVLLAVGLGPSGHVVCWQQLRVAGFLAAFSGFNYMLVSATDARLRQDATDAAAVIIRQACALRLVLLDAGRSTPHAPGVPGEVGAPPIAS